MFDNIGSEQVKCFDCELKSYKIGDIVPCDVFGYENNLLIMPFDTSLTDIWTISEFIVIRDSKVYQLKTIADLKDSDFNNIDEVITYMGNKINITHRNELLEYIEDVMILKVKNDMSDLRKVKNYDYLDDFEKKWNWKY